MNYTAGKYKSKKIAQIEQNFAPSHDGETVTFKNSVFRTFGLHCTDR